MGTPPADWCICHGCRSNNSCLKSWQIWPDKRRADCNPLCLPTSTKVVTWLLVNGCWFCSGAFSKAPAKQADLVAFARHRRRPAVQARGFGAGCSSAALPWPRAQQGSGQGWACEGELTSWCNALVINTAKGEGGM